MTPFDTRGTKVSGENLKRLRKSARLSQFELSSLLGVHQTAISQWECGRTMPDVASLRRLAALYSVSIDSLLGTASEAAADPEKYEAVRGRLRAESRRVPILGNVQAGVPVSAIEDIVGYVALSDEYNTEADEFFGLKIKGSSMEPRFMEGDTVIVRHGAEVESGDIVVVLIDSEATIKQLKKLEDGIMLIPFNREFEPTIFSSRQIEELPVRILGKVIELRAKV